MDDKDDETKNKARYQPWREAQNRSLIHNPQKGCEKNTLLLFKLPSLWHFVTSALENEFRGRWPFL